MQLKCRHYNNHIWVGLGGPGIGGALIAQHGIPQCIPNSSKATHRPAPADFYTPGSARQMRLHSKQLNMIFFCRKAITSGSNRGVWEVRVSLCYILAETCPQEVALVKGGADSSSEEVPMERASRG